MTGRILIMVGVEEKQVLLKSFLENFSIAVISGDVESMRPHFDKTVVSFGTRALVCKTLDDLVANQWMQIWGKCQSWEISSVDAMNLDSELAFVAFRWRRVSFSGSEQTGRATLAFGFVETRLVVLHSHFSESPKHDSNIL
jgi:hypothetical protein